MNKTTMEHDILHGKILPTIFKLAIPIATLSLFGFLYNIINMIFVGQSGGADMVAAIAAGAVITQLWIALMNLARVGAQVRVAQAIGENNDRKAQQFAKASVQLAFFLSLGLGIASLVLAQPLVVITGIQDAHIITNAQWYIYIMALGLIPYFVSNILTGNLNGEGDTKATLYFNGIGLLVNIILDYIFIIMFKQGVIGAAVATIISQYITFILTYIYWRRPTSLFKNVQLRILDTKAEIWNIVKLGFPNAFNRILFVVFSILLARALTSFGDTVMGVQRIGIQVESLTWMMSFGIAQAFSTFVGQNFGANNMERIRVGYRRVMSVMLPYGLAVSLGMVVFAPQIFGLFLPSSAPEYQVGVVYLQILGLSQLFMVMEIVTTGGFEGLGRTVIPSTISIIFTGLRVPAAYIGIALGLGLSSVWWAISISSVIKGILAFIIFVFIAYRATIKENTKNEVLK